jgi:hypothetical protein
MLSHLQELLANLILVEPGETLQAACGLVQAPPFQAVCLGKPLAALPQPLKIRVQVFDGTHRNKD